MPIPNLGSFLVESIDSRQVKASLKNPTVTLKYTAVNFATPEMARAYTVTQTPVNYPDYPFLWRDAIEVTPLGGSCHAVVVPYVVIEGDVQSGGPAGTQHKNETADHNPDQPLGPEFSFDTTGGTQHIGTSIQTRAASGGILTMGNPGASPNYFRSINVTDDGVKGLDRHTSRFDWQVTVHFPTLTHKYLDRLKVMSGRAMNKRFFFGRWGCECLFLGARGTWRQSDAWAVTFSFSDSATWGYDAWKQRGLTGGPSTPANKPQRFFNDPVLDIVRDANNNRIKRGWDYVWGVYTKQPSSGFVIEKLAHAYFEQIYWEMDFYWLGIGGAKKPPADDLVPPEEQDFI